MSWYHIREKGRLKESGRIKRLRQKIVCFSPKRHQNPQPFDFSLSYRGGAIEACCEACGEACGETVHKRNPSSKQRMK